jgi:hypothetical protein
MILVPLLVGITILTVAHAARRQVLGELEELSRRERIRNESASPLCEAFPHLRLWVPSGDAIYQATHQPTGSRGPDIIFGPRRRELTDAA